MPEKPYPSQSTSYFALPLPLWQQPVSYRTAKYERLKQRGRYRGIHDGETGKEHDSGHESEDAITGEEVQNSTGEGTRNSRPRSPLIFSPAEAHQYRIAGLPNYCELPGRGFPHKAPFEGEAAFFDSDDESDGDENNSTTTGTANKPRKKKGKIINNRQRIEKDLSQLNPPLYLAGGNPTKKNTLRLHHLNVLTAILHRCLMEGDYIRAGRAWGLILRDNFGGHPADVRSAGRWAVGAEILLWKDRSQGESEDAVDQSGKVGGSRKWFTRTGFERAKEYYERMIIQYQYRKVAPDALGPLHFYPAMFGLWISVSQEESQHARGKTELAGSSDGFDAGEDDYYDRMSVTSGDIGERKLTLDQRTKIHTAARMKELEEARQIATQMDELLVSPPFSDSHELLRLRGMVSLWIGDLYLSSVLSGNDVDELTDDSYGNDDGTARLEATILRMEISSAREKRATEIEKAKSFFAKARARQDRTRSTGG
ncbi:uncharacterized protein GIQ15_06174 [Arthroderma uncinatum]|uniref:uncharacterized protein n=1 Tax=Arthroderma uncinatum TaxID=74035 RepID=UPI00144ADF3D|nr:uncharacterized protein GIQ15_06174 [Arthroderma uncinatum]KAF3480827.1 hypothetical protein GIQ15_06174 [Arthroderma uncinatum]